ncbi:hypothetical protein LTR41_007814 [Exophiala xenobiotica]|nr:hypothetical protein LTR41_007814 [Exophiala xenobiotica]
MSFIRKSFRYIELLVSADPTSLDYSLLLTGTVCAIASGVPFPLIGILFGQLIDNFNSATCTADEQTGNQPDYQGQVNSKILLILYLAIAQFITIYVHLTCWSLGGARLAQRLRESYLRNLLRQEPSFFDNVTPGEVASRLNGDIQTIRSGTSEKVGICLSSASFFVTAYIVAFIKDTKLAGMLIWLFPAYFLMSLVGSHYIEKYSELVSTHAASAASISAEALSNVIVVHAFGASARLEKIFSQHQASSEREGVKKAFATGVQSGVMYFIAYAGNALAFWQGSKQIAHAVSVDSTGASVGKVFTVIFIMVEATLVLSQVAPFIQMFGAALASFNTIRDDMSHQSSIDATTDDDGIHLENVNGAFELKRVSFRYPSRPDTVILQELNLDIPAGKHTAIVGMSGSGKSTIAGLLTRLYDPTDGQILLDGQDLRTLNARQLRSHIGLVQQEPSLLNRSILENIAHGLVNSAHPAHSRLVPILLGPQLSILAESIRNGADILAAAQEQGTLVVEIVELVQQAAALADVTNFISSLKDDYGTLVGAGGRLVSGGQKQRIALARALVKDPKILILDEATAALDSASEQRIQAAISKVAAGRTMITVAHRLATVKYADKIIVLKEGMILEEGDHTTLIAKAGTYANLVQMQTIGANTEEDLESSLGSLEVDSPIRDTLAGEKRPDQASQQEVEPFAADDDGNAELEDEIPASSSRSLASVMHGLSRIVRPYTLVIVMALLAASIVGGAFSAEAVIFGNTVGRLNPCKSESSIRAAGNFFGLMFFVLAIIEFFANLVSWSAFGWLSERMLYIVRLLSFRSLFEQSLQWHQSENRTPAKLLLYITKDGNALAGLSGSVLGTIFSISVNLVVAIVLTHLIAWKIALVCLALVPLLLGAGLMELRVLGKFEEKHENAFAESVDISVEAISSIKTVAALGLEKETLMTYRRSLKGPRKETTAVSLQASLWLALMYFLGNMVNALAYWWGSKQIISGAYTQTQFLIVVFSLLVSAMLWSQMFALAPELSSAWAAVARILDLIDIGSTKVKDLKVEKHWAALAQSSEKDIEALAEPKAPVTNLSSGSSVSFRDITFAYPARLDMKVLQGLNLDIPSGQFCALVGPSGAGKSTIISLIEGMYRPQSGSILVDGVDITRQKDFSFRDEISLVPQDSVLFEGTVAFNVGLGARPDEEASRADIEDACRLANIHETILSLPQGYDTLCGPNGSQLSGGQRQRLSIARALVRKPRLLILDESTSALDAESEKLLQEGLAKASKGITVIAIAHRLHTIKQANIIFLIEGGKCVDHGSHSELFQRSESYRSNVLHQALGDVEQVAP